MTRLALIVSLALLATACSAGERRASLDDEQPVKTTTVTLARSYRFDPEVIQVNAGDTVTWKNEDNFTHDVQLKSGDDTKRHELEPGDKVKVTFDEPGTYDFVCNLHPRDMRGRVVVT
jgi:plastocyanin